MPDPISLADLKAAFRRDPARVLGVATTAGLAFVIPIGPTLVGAMTIIVALLWVVRGRFRCLGRQIRGNGVVRAALLLFALLIVGLLYTPVELDISLSVWKKYRELLLVPILMAMAESERERRVVIAAFMASMLMCLVLAYGEWFGWYNIGRLREPTTFHHRIIYGTFLAFFIFWTAHRGTDYQGWRRRLAVAIVVLGTVHLFYAIGSRTAYVIYFALALLFAYQRFAWRVAALALALLALACGLLLTTSPIFSHRVTNAAISVFSDEPREHRTSTDHRLQQWGRTLRAIGDAPIVGHGTGAYGFAVSKYLVDRKMRRGQTHSEFLMITVQLGVVGLAALLWLFFVQARTAVRMRPPDAYLAQGFVATIILSATFNSTLINSAEGHFYGLLTAMLFAQPVADSHDGGSA